MKRILALTLAVLCLFALASCGGKTEDTPKDETTASENNTQTTAGNSDKTPATAEPVFVYNNVKVKMNDEADPIVSALGEPNSTYEAPSCAFQGNDYYYDYGSFQVSAYEDNGTRRISAVILKDDLVTTAEGISIGSTDAEALAAFGESARSANGNYIVSAGSTTLTVIITDSAVSSILYAISVD